MESGASSKPIQGKQEKFMHKGRLQGYTQRASLPFPSYQTFQEEAEHPPRFRSNVVVDGETFVSPLTFGRRREAEQYVAQFALESILNKIKKEGIPMIHNDSIFCKSILHEYARKMKMELPTYTTSESKGLLPMFVTSVVFDGRTYQGGVGRNKKAAEQNGARTVIEQILGQSDTSLVMAEIVKSKSRLFNSIYGNTSVKVYNVSNGNDVPIVSTDDKLPEIPAVENPKEGTVLTLAQKIHTESSTNELLISVPNDSSILQTIQIEEKVLSGDPLIHPSESQSQIEEEVLSVDQLMLRSESQSLTPSSTGKRSRRKNKRGSSSKKMKVEE